MSQDDSSAPETAPHSGAAAGRSRNPFVLAGLALVLVLGLVTFFAMRGNSDTPEGSDCVSEKVSLTTAPVMEDLVKAAVKDVNADEPCIDIQVTAGTVKDVVALLADPNAELPEYNEASWFFTLPFSDTEFQVNIEDTLNPLKGIVGLDFAPRVTTALRWKEISLIPSFGIRETYYGSSYIGDKVAGGNVRRSARDFTLDLVLPSLARVFDSARQKLIVACFASHIHRVQQVLNLAVKHGRKVVYVGRSMVRNMGVALGYALIGYDSLMRGLDKLEANPARLAEDLDANWEVLAEPIQTVMRRYGLEKPYEQLKKLTRGKRITATRMAKFIDGLAIPDAAKKDLLAMTPASYTGKATTLAKRIAKG